MTQAIISKRFDYKLGLHGISLNDYMILFHLYQAPEGKLRRIDLAEKIGVSASGVTRLLAPLEKIGLTGRKANKRDARVSYVTLTTSGKRVLTEATESAEVIASDLYPGHEKSNQDTFTDVLLALGGSVR